MDRLEKSIQNPRFIERVYGPHELALWRERNSSLPFLAGCFCAKEAFSKALGTGVRGFALREVEVLRDALGKPFFQLSGSAARLAAEKDLRFDVSISHDGEYAIAFVTAWHGGA